MFTFALIERQSCNSEEKQKTKYHEKNAIYQEVGTSPDDCLSRPYGHLMY